MEAMLFCLLVCLILAFLAKITRYYLKNRTVFCSQCWNYDIERNGCGCESNRRYQRTAIEAHWNPIHTPQELNKDNHCQHYTCSD